jgi:2,3-bisphosphoglycerate-dependent phosphoglycerate mutase
MAAEQQPRFTSQQPYALPAKATQVVLVRHGSALVAAPDAEPFALLDGHNDPPLAPEGMEQAEVVGARLQRRPPDRIFVSSLRRTQETAAPLAAALGAEPIVLPELREVHLGEWEGQFTNRISSRNPTVAAMLAEQRWDVIPGAEPTADFRARVAVGMQRVLEETGPGGTAAVFAHGAVIAEVCRSATGSRPLAFLFAENTSLTRLAHVGEGSWVLRSFNDVSHLPD